MLFRSHIVFSLFLYLIFFNFLEISLPSKLVFGIFLFLSTVFVDIDSRNSKIGRYFIFRPIQWLVSHRGMIHSLLFCFFSSFFIFWIDSNAGIGFLVGYLSHLFLDSLTKEGVFLLWPFYSERISLIGFKTGGIIEEIFFVLLLLCDVFMTIKLFF